MYSVFIFVGIFIQEDNDTLHDHICCLCISQHQTHGAGPCNQRDTFYNNGVKRNAIPLFRKFTLNLSIFHGKIDNCQVPNYALTIVPYII